MDEIVKDCNMARELQKQMKELMKSILFQNSANGLDLSILRIKTANIRIAVNKKLDEEYTNLLDLNLAVIELLTGYQGKEYNDIKTTILKIMLGLQPCHPQEKVGEQEEFTINLLSTLKLKIGELVSGDHRYKIHYNLDEIVERRAVLKSKIMDLFIQLFKTEINKLEKRGCEEKNREKRKSTEEITMGVQTTLQRKKRRATTNQSVPYDEGVSKLYTDLGDASWACQYCNARFWYGERLKGTAKNTVKYNRCCGGGQQYQLPSIGTLGAIVFESGPNTNTDHDVIIEYRDRGPQRINKLHSSYMSLQYPLLFVYGQPGYNTKKELFSIAAINDAADAHNNDDRRRKTQLEIAPTKEDQKQGQAGPSVATCAEVRSPRAASAPKTTPQQ
ncbi:replication protein [Artemisia annua]|uniref:Replication protein n=1 Tax=Artemisia annua TaxID=35608 RepID=A0A2U1L7H7_ARTAN|nr:replication protein [Artemisia annua]